MKKNTKKAITLAELIVALMLTTFVAGLVVKSFTTSSDEVTKMAFKNAVTSFKLALENLVTNPVYYAINGDLADISTVTLDGVVYGGESKFREIILNELAIDVNFPVKCEVLIGDKVEIFDKCYVQDNGVVWGIPNTDFTTKNLKRVESAQGTVSNYLPITIYTGEKILNEDSGYFNSQALILGVRKDGALTPINVVDCELPVNKNLNQCRVEEFFTSIRYRK